MNRSRGWNRRAGEPVGSRLGLSCVIALVLLMGLPAVGSAASNPSLDQYVESVPSAGGGGNAPGGSAPQASHLPAPVQHQIDAQGGSDAKALQALAGSPAAGAPAQAPGRGGSAAGGSGRSGGSSSGSGGKSGSRPPTAAIDTASANGDSSHLGWLVAGLVIVTLAIGGAGLMRRGRRSV